jgi:hypothetical protein
MKLILGLSAIVLATALKLQTGTAPVGEVFDTNKSQAAFKARTAEMQAKFKKFDTDASDKLKAIVALFK